MVRGLTALSVEIRTNRSHPATAAVRLHQRHVLVGRCVEDDVGPEALHHLEHPLAFLAVGEHRLVAAEMPPLGHLAIDREQVVLGVVDEDEQPRANARDLARELRPDRAAGPGDEHDPVLEVGADPVELHHYRVPPEHVLHSHLAKLARELHAASQQLEHGRQGANRDPVVSAGAHDLRADGARGRRDRDHDLVGLRPVEDRPDLAGGAEDADPERAHPPLARIVVDEPDRARAEVGVELELPHDHLPTRPGADDEDVADRPALGEPARAFGEHPRAEPRGAREHEGEQQVEDDHRPRQRIRVRPRQREDPDHDRARDRDAAQERPQLREAKVAPPLAV